MTRIIESQALCQPLGNAKEGLTWSSSISSIILHFCRSFWKATILLCSSSYYLGEIINSYLYFSHFLCLFTTATILWRVSDNFLNKKPHSSAHKHPLLPIVHKFFSLEHKISLKLTLLSISFHFLLLGDEISHSIQNSSAFSKSDWFLKYECFEILYIYYVQSFILTRFYRFNELPFRGCGLDVGS